MRQGASGKNRARPALVAAAVPGSLHCDAPRYFPGNLNFYSINISRQNGFVKRELPDSTPSKGTLLSGSSPSVERKASKKEALKPNGIRASFLAEPDGIESLTI